MKTSKTVICIYHRMKRDAMTVCVQFESGMCMSIADITVDPNITEEKADALAHEVAHERGYMYWDEVPEEDEEDE